MRLPSAIRYWMPIVSRCSGLVIADERRVGRCRSSALKNRDPLQQCLPCPGNKPATGTPKSTSVYTPRAARVHAALSDVEEHQRPRPSIATAKRQGRLTPRQIAARREKFRALSFRRADAVGKNRSERSVDVEGEAISSFEPHGSSDPLPKRLRSRSRSRLGAQRQSRLE